MVSYLKEASPWIRFIGILGYISCGMMGVLAVGIITTAPFMGELSDTFGAFGRGALVAFGLLYLALGALVFFPAMFTYNFGVRIRNYLRSNSEQELELAFKNNKSLWKFMGIMAIVNLAIVPVLLVVGVIAMAGSLLG
jgi:hypothetical protein